MQSPDGTVVFVEVRKRSRSDFGGAAATIGAVKQRRIVFAARHYLLNWRQLPPARFDVVTLEGQGLQWLQAAFDAS
jgi:putative endonuclease